MLLDFHSAPSTSLVIKKEIFPVRRPMMLGIMACTDQKDSCSDISISCIAGDNALRACSLVGRPMMFNITAVLYSKDSCDMVPMFDCKKLRSLRSCSPSRSSTSLSFRRGRSPWSRLFSRPLRLPSCCSISDGRCPVVHYVQVHFPARRTIETSQLQYASDRRCPCCAVPQFSSADVEETVELPQLRPVERGHCRAHARRCATTDAWWFRRHNCCDVARLISSWRR